MAVHATPLPTPLRFPGLCEVGRVVYDSGRLTIQLVDAQNASHGEVCVRFESVEALRVMDERDLLEYWPACLGPNWLFEVHSGGWLSQETQRSTNAIPEFYPGLKEYLIGGHFECVSVLSAHAPVIDVVRAASL